MPLRIGWLGTGLYILWRRCDSLTKSPLCTSTAVNAQTVTTKQDSARLLLKQRKTSLTAWLWLCGLEGIFSFFYNTIKLRASIFNTSFTWLSNWHRHLDFASEMSHWPWIFEHEKKKKRKKTTENTFLYGQTVYKRWVIAFAEDSSDHFEMLGHNSRAMHVIHHKNPFHHHTSHILSTEIAISKYFH